MEANLPIVDSHFHVWNLSKFSYPWPTKESGVLFRSFSLDEYEKSRNTTNVKYSVFVQVLNGNIDEAKWMLEQVSSSHPTVYGVVAGLNPVSPKFGEDIEELCQYEKFVGIRHILDFEDKTWISRKDVVEGLKILAEKNKTYDLLLRPHLLKYIPPLVEKLPNLKFVVDHIAKPFMEDNILDPWREEMAAIAKYTNVYCKISGLVSETTKWKSQDLSPYVNHILEVFGTDRCMFGSDWPVCTSAGAEYEDVFQLFKKYIGHLSMEDKKKLLYQNAVDFYSLKI